MQHRGFYVREEKRNLRFGWIDKIGAHRFAKKAMTVRVGERVGHHLTARTGESFKWF